MLKERKIFIEGYVNDNGEIEVEGCLRRGVSAETASSIYDEMESFASYAFNKSHAAAYAAISYQTAWLKCHYPKEYMAALLTSVLDNQNKMAVYIGECQRLGIQVLPPHVNESYNGFTVVGSNIRFGLMAIKNLGKSFIDTIINQRKLGNFTSFYDFCKRLYGNTMNSRALESLIKCGALDNLGTNRRQMLAMSKTILDDIDYEKKKNLNGQMSFFDLDANNESSGEPPIVQMEEFPVAELLFMENEIAGMYLSGHPLGAYYEYAKYLKADKIGNIVNSENTDIYKDGSNVRLLCIISKVKNQLTRSNKMMAFVTVEDKFGSIEMLVFPQTMEQYGKMLYQGNIIEVTAAINSKEDEETKIICNTVKAVPPADKLDIPQKTTTAHIINAESVNGGCSAIYLKVSNLQSREYKKAVNLLEIFQGDIPVIFYLYESKKQLKAPRNLWADPNKVLINELKYQLGEENVKLK